jgi:L-2-hydroxyglutarate oxidase LhgO
MDSIEAIVVGAGVIGLAIAAALARRGHEVVVLESEGKIGTGISSRHSEVIHAGIYYPPGSLKAKLCVRGRDLLYRYCADRGIPFRRIGKMIVAFDDQERLQLDRLYQRATTNGVTDLLRLDAGQARKTEPLLNCREALFSGASGIIDSHSLMLAYQDEAERHGAVIAFYAPFVGARALDEGFVVEVGGNESCRVKCRYLVNAAGLSSAMVAGRIEGLPRELVPRTYFCKGSYFRLTGASPFMHLVYPLPGNGGLGIHLTVDMAGQARFGPDAEWRDTMDFHVDVARADRFYPEIRRYWPDLPDSSLLPDYAGIRPKISGPLEPPADFRIDGPSRHGIPGLVNLFGIESPGLTASLAVAEYVSELVGHPSSG